MTIFIPNKLTPVFFFWCKGMIFLHNSQMKTAEILSFSSFLDLCQECQSRYTLNRTNPSLYWNSYECLDNPFMLLSKREILWSRTLKPGNRGLAGLSHSPSPWTLFPSSIDRSSRSRQIAEPGSGNCRTRVLQLRDPGLAEIPALGRVPLRVVNPFRLRLPFHRFSP